jgi:SAM-dependent methyltransferase
MTSPDQQYLQYLQQRSWKGHLYRRHWLYPRLVRHLRGRVLDVGCGIGDMLRFRPGTVGVDVNPETVAVCRAGGLDARVMQPDVLPFANATFDGLILDNVLEHLAAPMPLLLEIRRVLVPGGRLLAGVPGKRGFQADPDHKAFYDAQALASIMASAGLHRVQLFHMPLDLAWLDARMSAYCLYGVFERPLGAEDAA